MNRLLATVLFLAACGNSIPVGQKATPTNTPVSGATCKQDTECVTGEACDTNASKCEKICGQDQDCGTGEWCQSGMCQTKPAATSSGSSSGSGSSHCTTATVSADCKAGQVCVRGQNRRKLHRANRVLGLCRQSILQQWHM